ncbi:MAG: 2-hydroxyacyl-CoA dehydratase [Chloroflexi bacterium]|nr:2-hydroxyacyl-CoA dehydratase [Chloroflexota bacterium]
MLESHRMVERDGLLLYPEEIKERFLATGPLPFRDGTQASPEEIWEFMTDEGPRRFPYIFTSNPNSPQRLPYYVDLIGSIKLYYLIVSRRFRVERLRKQGKPLVLVQGGQPLEPYYAADALPLRPGDVTELACYYVAEGMDIRNKDWKVIDIREEGSRTVSMEACHQITAHAAIRNDVVPVDLIAPYTRARCSDVTFLAEAHRDSPRKVDTFLVDYPTNYISDKTWAVEYVAENVRRLIARTDAVSGRTTTADDFRRQVRAYNRIRRLARETVEAWRSAPVPPAASVLLFRLFALGKDCDGDPVATEHIFTQFRDEVRERTAIPLKGGELAERPARIFKCGSCVVLNLHALDRAGGALVSADDGWSDVSIPDVEEEGDIFENYARATLSAPYELPTEKRARWILDQIRQSRAEGLIFGYQWGCNFQSAVARMVCDIVQKEAGIPTTTLSLDELGRGESTEQTQNRIAAFVEMLSYAA